MVDSDAVGPVSHPPEYGQQDGRSSDQVLAIAGKRL